MFIRSVVCLSEEKTDDYIRISVHKEDLQPKANCPVKKKSSRRATYVGKKNKKKNRKKSSKWTPPKGSSAYFFAASDYKFKEKHPIGYGFLVLLGIVALMLPYNINSAWMMLGWVGAFIVGIGLFNFVGIIIKQYLGHLVSILSFVIGGVLIWISLVQMGIV